MYLEYFGLNQLPFNLTPNTHFYLNGDSHQEAMALLQVALENREGFIKIVGEVGSGKTLLCRKLLNHLGDEYLSAYIPNPALEPDDLYCMVLEELGLEAGAEETRHQRLKRIYQRLIELAGDGKTTVLLIDEAQVMPESTMEAVRLLTNLETESSKLLQVVLFGQPELDDILERPEFRQLHQRITFSYQLRPLSPAAVAQYIPHRLSLAGYNGSQLFTSKAMGLIARYGRGVPRVINILCHKSLLSAYGRGDRQIEAFHVRRAALDSGLKTRFRWRWTGFLLVGLGVTAVASTALMASAAHMVSGENIRLVSPKAGAAATEWRVDSP